MTFLDTYCATECDAMCANDSWVQQVTLKTEAKDVEKIASNSLLVCVSVIRSDECQLCWSKSFS